MHVTDLRRNRSRLYLHARFTDGIVGALTGQPHTFTRAATATYTDSNGVTGTAPHSRPRFEVTDGVPALLIESAESETLYYDWPVAPARAFSALAVMLVPPTPDTDYIFRIAGAAPGITFRLNAGDEVRGTHFNGASNVMSTTAGLDASPGDVVEAVLRYQADGAVQVEAAKNGGTVVTASASATLAPAASWESARFSVRNTDAGRQELRELKVHPDPDLTFVQLRGA